MSRRSRLTSAAPRIPPAIALLAIGAAVASLTLTGLPGLVADIGGSGRRAMLLHLFLAGGVMPLIFLAMELFAPVLAQAAARTAPGGPALLALAAGALAVSGQVWRLELAHGGAALGLAATGWLAWRIRELASACLGTPHPCLLWYQAALLCLAVALGALLLSLAFPEQWTALRRLHLHLNLLGFVALTAFATLQVLLPTAAGYTDAGTRQRLVLALPWALTGTLTSALGAAWWPPLAWVGPALWLVALARFAGPVLVRTRAVLADGPATSLLLALAGLGTVFAVSALHGFTAGTGARLSWMFVLCFLVPLLGGALAHLLPRWRFPGPDSEGRRRLARRRAGGARSRALLAFTGGLLALGELAWAPLLGAAAAGEFLLRLAWALAERPGEGLSPR